MARIKIKDLPKDTKISKEEMKRILGGTLTYPVEGLSLNFAPIKLNYQKQEPSGSSGNEPQTYKVEENKGA